jgi:hypothetical protein
LAESGLESALTLRTAQYVSVAFSKDRPRKPRSVLEYTAGGDSGMSSSRVRQWEPGGMPPNLWPVTRVRTQQEQQTCHRAPLGVASGGGHHR